MIFGKKKDEPPVADTGDVTETPAPKLRRRRRDEQEEAVQNAHPGGHPDDVHKNLFSL